MSQNKASPPSGDPPKPPPSTTPRGLPPPSLLPRPTSAASDTPPTTPTPAAATRIPRGEKGALKTPRVATFGQGGSTLGGGGARTLARPSPPSGGRKSPAVLPRTLSSGAGSLPMARTPSSGNPPRSISTRGIPGTPGTPTPSARPREAEKRPVNSAVGRAKKQDRARSTSSASQGTESSQGSMEEQTYDRLEDFRSGITPGGKLVRKAWDKYDPNKLGRISSTEFLHLCDYLEEQIPGVEKGQISTDTARTIILRITETNEAHTIDEDELLDLYTNLNSGVDLLSFINRLLIAAPNPQSAHRRSTGAIVDLDEEDALTRETGNSYLSGNDSTIGLDMPSTIPIRSSTPVGGYRSGTQGRGNTPPTNPLFEDKDFKTLKLPFTGVPLSREQLHALPRADIEAYYSEWRILRRDYKKVIDEIKISKGDVKEKDLELRNLQITFEERLQAYRQDIEDLRKDGKDSEEMLQRLKKENESLHQNIEELEGLLEKSEEGNHELGEEKDRRQDQAKSAERRIIELEGKLGGRDKFDQTTSTQFSQMQKRFDDQERAKSEAIEEAGRLNDLCLKLQHDLEKASEEVAALKDNNQLLNRDINQLERTPTTTDAGSNVGEPEDLGTIMNLANIASSDIFLGEHVELETVVVMNRCGKEVQTDIVIPSALDHKEALLMMNDPELGAVKMIRALVGCGGLRHKALFSDVLRVIDGLNVRSSEEAAADITTAMEAEARRAAKSGRAFPPIPQDEQGYFPVIEHQKETFSGPESNGTQTIPPPEDTYEESIKTDHATVTKIKSLLQKPTLDVDEATFLNEFTEQQLGFLLKAFWNLKVKADRAARSAGRTNAIHTMHSLFNWLPFSFRQIWNMVYSLDAADEAARAFEAEKNPGGENTNEPANGEQLRQAPKSPLAVLLLARPRPGSVWSILTMFLFMLLVALLVGNLHMYLTMHREQSMWADVNDGPPAWRSGCWRVCSGSGGGSGWRWKGIIREWLSEGILG